MTNDARRSEDETSGVRGDRDAVAEAVDVLLSRAAAGDAKAHAEIVRRSQSDPSLLVELAAWQSAEIRLGRIARELHSYAEGVELPAERRGLSGRWPPVVSSGVGWAVAAMIALAWIGRSVLPARGLDSRPLENRAGLAGFTSADDAFDAYVDRARADGLIFGEVAPPTLVATREVPAAEGGGLEVVVVRQVVERRRLPAIYQLAPNDESGRLVPMPIRPWTEHVR